MAEVKFNVVLLNAKTGETTTILRKDQFAQDAQNYARGYNETVKAGYYAILEPIPQAEEKVPFNELPFDQQLVEQIKQNMMTTLSKLDFIMPDYNNRVKVPAGFYQKAWDMVDHEQVLKNLAVRIEQELADRIMNHLASEMATDIKQLLGDKDRREVIRGKAREILEQLGGAK